MSAGVDWMWSTPVLVEDLSESLSADELGSLRLAEERRLLDAVRDLGLLERLEEAFGQTGLAWTCRVHELGAGEYRSPGYDAGDIHACLVLDRTQITVHEDSGNVVLADPRSGIQNVFVPGMPWNKAISMRAEPGRLLAAPGWVSSMITPLADGESLAWLQIRGTRG